MTRTNREMVSNFFGTPRPQFSAPVHAENVVKAAAARNAQPTGDTLHVSTLALLRMLRLGSVPRCYAVQVHWQRAARTDKGVSAVGQVVSLKMITEPEGAVDRINSHLPPQLRVRPIVEPQFHCSCQC